MTDDAELPIASTPDALTPQWLTAALGSAVDLADTVVTDVRMTPVGTGQMCDSIRLTLTFSAATDAPSTVVAKIPSANSSSRAAGHDMGIYEAEVRFYQHLAGRLAVRTPHVFHADIDPESSDFVLVLEDLAPATQGDQLAGCTLDQAACAIDELIKLHAPLWESPELAALTWLDRGAELRGMLAPALGSFWTGFVERYGVRLHPAVFEAGEGLIAAMDVFDTRDTHPHTVTHGDFRLDNLLFGDADGDTPIAVVDWQTCSVGPPLGDVAYFIGSGLLPEQRRIEEHDLVRRYHEGIVAAGVTGFDWAACWACYRLGTFGGLIMAIAASMLVERTDRGDEMFLAMAERHAIHILDLDALELLAD